MRGHFLVAVTIFGAALFAITELLGAFAMIRRTPLILCWSLLIVVAAVAAARRRPFGLPHLSFDPVVVLCILGCAGILALTAITAAYSPPNSTDAMAYHLPRVIYWAEQASVRFFPTQYLNQIMLQPFTEYWMLHLYVISGSDRLTNFVQWFASLACMVGVSLIAREFGANGRGQALAALFCATIPAGVLASSGAKNDYFVAMWLVLSVYFALCFAADGKILNATFLGIALGCALLSKATAYLFAPWPILAVLLLNRRIGLSRVAAGMALSLAIAATINAPQYARNYDFSGSVLGFDSAQGDGVYRWRNDTISLKNTISNVLRNVAEQFGGRDPRWNQGVYEFVVGLHQDLGADVNDPRTTWPWTVYEPPRNANHEVNVPNKWQLMLLGLISGFLAVSAVRTRDFRWLGYISALICGFVAFCAYLKWQLFLGRMFLPLLVLGSPLIGAVPKLFSNQGHSPGKLARTGLVMVEALLALFLISNARRPVLENWIRPLKGERSVLHTPRDQQYFADMTPWKNRDTYFSTVDLLVKSGCDRIGLDTTNFQLEYPLIALLREKAPGSDFIHTGVQNASARYRQPVDASPCAVVCLDCAGDGKRLSLYADFSKQIPVDKFVVLFRD